MVSMNEIRNKIVPIAGLMLVLSAAYLTAQAPAPRAGQAPAAPAQGPGQRTGGPGRGPAPDLSKPQILTVGEGTRARYKVQEQLAGISFPSEAVGSTEAVTGVIAVNPDGSFGPQSKIVVELTKITSDQSMRDGYVQGRVFETEKFPLLEIVPKSTVGLASPLPTSGQAGFQLITAMTLHGVTKDITWTVVSTFANDAVNGRATTTTDFATFNLTKPTLARLLSVDDKIQLEIEFKARRTTP